MAPKKLKPTPKPRSSERSRSSKRQDKVVEELAELVRREVEKRLGPEATFEERQDMSFEIMRDVLWKRTDDDLQSSVSDTDEVEVGGKRYRRLNQASSATYFGRWGSHHVEEHLYRELGTHNGPTIKPVELRTGIIEHMTPNLAHVVGALSAERGSRGLERTLRTVGLSPPSRAFLADHVTEMGREIADMASELEAAARRAEALPANVASVSCGLDRMSVRMSEPVPNVEGTPRRSRSKPYERKPPPPKEYHYRKAWVGSTSAYDAEGNELHTWRVAVEADADPAQLAARVAADVAWIAHRHPKVAVHCIQDAAPELRVTLEALDRALPADMEAVELVDFEHLMGYLDNVVDACDPDDVHEMKSWYRDELLKDDAAIDRIEADPILSWWAESAC